MCQCHDLRALQDCGTYKFLGSSQAGSLDSQAPCPAAGMSRDAPNAVILRVVLQELPQGLEKRRVCVRFAVNSCGSGTQGGCFMICRFLAQKKCTIYSSQEILRCWLWSQLDGSQILKSMIPYHLERDLFSQLL